MRKKIGVVKLFKLLITMKIQGFSFHHFIHRECTQGYKVSQSKIARMFWCGVGERESSDKYRDQYKAGQGLVVHARVTKLEKNS